MADGFFLGGFAKGMESSEKARLAEKTQADDASLRARAIDIQEKNLLRDQENKETTRIDAVISNLMSVANETVKGGLASGQSSETIKQVIAPLVENAKTLAARVGREPSTIDAQANAFFMQPTGQQAAVTKGQTTAAERVAQRDALVSSGVDVGAAAETAGIKPSAPKLTEGQKALDKKFADDYAGFVAAGGYADVDKQLKQLMPVLYDLEGGKKNLTGPVLGSMPDFVTAVTNPEAISTRQAVEEVVQRNLRLVLGAQFTEKEGEALIARAFNPRLDEKENAKRLRNLVTQIRTAAIQKEQAANYFEANGTLSGFRGRLPSFREIGVNLDSEKSQERAPQAGNAPPPPPGYNIVVPGR